MTQIYFNNASIFPNLGCFYSKVVKQKMKKKKKYSVVLYSHSH